MGKSNGGFPIHKGETMELPARSLWLAGAALLIAVLVALWAPIHGEAAAGSSPGATAGTVDRVPSMTGPKAKFVISRILKRNYKRVWIFGEKKRITDCRRLSRIRVSCKVSWIYKNNFLHGRAAAYYRRNGSIFVKYNIHVDRI
jgi:hypothetical protein